MNTVRALIGVVDHPAEALEAVAQRPRSWWLPAVLLALSMAGLIAVSQPYQLTIANERSAQMIERIAANLSEEEARVVRERSRPMTPAQYWLSAMGAGLAFAGLGWVLRGAVMHFSSMAAGGTSTFGPTFAVGVWSMLPFFVRDLLQIAYVLFRKQVIEHAGLAFLVASGDWMKDSRNLLYGLLSNVDLFALWHVILLAIGLAVATRLTRGKAFVMAMVIWVAFLGLKLIPVALSIALAGRFMS